MTTIDTEALRALADAGYDEIVRLCRPTEHWRMSVPADPTRDSDLILADVCLAVPALLDALAEREGEVARLRRWEDEALPVMAGLQDLGRVLGLRLGTRITGEAAADAARALVARADDAEAKVRAVEGMCDKSDDDRRYWGHDYGGTISTDRLRAALATPEPAVQAWPREDVHTPPINPDCAAGNKHRACAGDAWDETTDSPTTCACECHAEVSR